MLIIQNHPLCVSAYSGLKMPSVQREITRNNNNLFWRLIETIQNKNLPKLSKRKTFSGCIIYNNVYVCCSQICKYENTCLIIMVINYMHEGNCQVSKFEPCNQYEKSITKFRDIYWSQKWPHLRTWFFSAIQI